MAGGTVRNIRDGTYDLANPQHVYIGRRNLRHGLLGSKWANPYPLHSEADRERVLTQYRQYVKMNARLYLALGELRGKVLYCWCAPKRCHGDVLLALLEEEN